MQDVFESARKLVSIFNGKQRASNEECYQRIADLIAIEGAPGVVIGEDPHGDYAYARFVGDVLPTMAREAGVTRFYTEIMHIKDQHTINWWQNTGDERVMIDHFNRYQKAYSPFMWHEYWKVLQAANECGMRIMAIDPHVYRVSHPGLHILDKNIAWEQFITKDQSHAPAPYILYCGEAHLPNRKMAKGGAVTDNLNVPGIRLRHGAVGFYPSPFSRDTYHCWRQPAHDQGIHLKARVFKAQPIPYGAS